MFGDTLLESSSASGKRKRWPMATAFTLELIIAGIVVLIPLFSTGVISVSAQVLPAFIPVKPIAIEPERPVRVDHSRADGPTTAASRAPVVLANNNKNEIYLGPPAEITMDPGEVTPPGIPANMPGDLINSRSSTASVGPGGPKRVISQLTEAQLLNRVEPAYPRIAVVSGVQGQVRLHAIIARDGTIQSLNVISGHPLLASAALDAVRQWRYRPYLLNGEAVEVETFITVNFRKDMR
jgi:periplasmic protein TonB